MPPRMHFNIRPITQLELPAVQALAHRIWPEVYDFLLSAEQTQNLLDAIYSLPQLEADMQAGHAFWLAEDDGGPFAFAAAYREGETLWLRKLYVLPQKQGIGAGRALMQCAIDHFAPVAEIRLNVNAHNLPAQARYRQWGFEEAARMPVRMGDYDFEDMVMRKALRDAMTLHCASSGA